MNAPIPNTYDPQNASALVQLAAAAYQLDASDIVSNITDKDGPVSTASAPTPGYFRFYTVAGNVVPQLYDPVSGYYYNLEIDTANGVRTLSLGDTAY